MKEIDPMLSTADELDSHPAPQEQIPALAVKGLSKSFPAPRGGTRRVLADVSLEVAPGEFVCIIGSSGTGKTTLLRCLAGLQPVDAGEVRVAGRLVNGPPAAMAVVFQDYSRSLMPWLTVGSNVALPLKSRGVGKAERTARAITALVEVGLDPGVAALHPAQLSGGMQQRVAIARALAVEADMLLMDEPFASVDAQTRSDLEDLVLKVRREHDLSVVMITHDIDEAVYLSDRVVTLGSSPATVTHEFTVDLGAVRNQLDTKSTREFADLRREMLSTLARR
ncbi:ABC transporter ATP-binding protein [Nocardioides sp. GXZ039]|uniref:ABC transporter ATP-binding protein n=1 Tax=Nocardioides sp. GXZ039 TaxID=3136018 RepID=UPI0030F4AFDF